MTAARLEYLQAQRIRLHRKQHGQCAHCRRIHRTPVSMELAHRIAESKANIRKWGFDVVDHDMNKGMTCRESVRGVRCNDALLLDGKPAIAAALVREIRERLGPVVEMEHAE